MHPLHLKQDSVWHEFHFLYQCFLKICPVFIHENAKNSQENHLCISINKFVDIANSRFAISAFFLLVTTQNHQKRVTMN
jgi:hypothetical protein